MKDDLDKFEINSKFENGDNSISLGELDGIMSKIKTYRKNNSEKSPHYIEKERENKELSKVTPRRIVARQQYCLILKHILIVFKIGVHLFFDVGILSIKLIIFILFSLA